MNDKFVGFSYMKRKPKVKELKKCALCDFMGIRPQAKYCQACSYEVARDRNNEAKRRVSYGK